MYLTILLSVGYLFPLPVVSIPHVAPHEFDISSKTQPEPKLRARTIEPRAFHPRTIDKRSSHVLSLEKNGQASSSRIFAAMHLESGLSPLTGFFDGLGYTTSIDIDGQKLNLIVDSGSSDTWSVKKNFTCASMATRLPIPEEECHFGPGYEPGENFTKVPDRVFNITYAGGERLGGYYGYNNVELGGIRVEKQQTGFVDWAAWNGDGSSSGILGLAYPPLTNSYEGQVPSDATRNGRRPYDPLFTTMYKRGLIPPTFSVAIQRNDSGYLALGGLPPVPVAGEFAATPIQYLKTGYAGVPKDDYAFYAMEVNSVGVNGKQAGASNSTNFQVIIDSGTTVMHLPKAIADEINSAFSPPSTYDELSGVYTVDCNATAPNVTVKIGGGSFVINPVDLILSYPEGGGCFAGVATDGFGLAVLGLTFLKNVLAVHDIGAVEMRFAQRFD